MNYLVKSLSVVAVSAIVCVSAGIPFEKTLSRAIQVSYEEQRPLMLLFISKDCKECESVQQFLEGDEVKEAVARRYVAARVDIGDFDGHACSEIYGIGEVPAIVIVDSEGTVMYKVQGDISIDELASMIHDNANTSANHEIPIVDNSKHKIPAALVDQNKISEPVTSAHEAITKEHAPVATQVRTMKSTDQSMRSSAHQDRQKITRQMVGSGRSYSLQLGFFSNLEYAIRLKEKAMQSGLVGVEVYPLTREGNDFFRVLFGRYPTPQAADLSSASLKESGFQVKVHRNQL